MTVEIICADAREALAAMPEGSVHTCVTSPPYWGLRDYGLEPTVWGNEGCMRVGDGLWEHEWGDSTVARQRPKRDHNGSGDFGETRGQEPSREGTAFQVSQGTFCRRCNAWRGTLGLEPTPDLYVEHVVQVMREVRRVLRDDGTLWLNLGDSYNAAGRDGHGTRIGYKQGTNRASANGADRNRPTAPSLKPKDLCGMPWRVAFALQSDGWWLRSDIVWSKPNPMPESVRDRPTRAHEYVFLLSKSARYYYDADAIREPAQDRPFNPAEKIERDPTGMIVSRRYNYAPGASGFGNHAAGRNKRSVWEIATQSYPEAHFAVFPERLVEPCILAGTSERGCCPECGAPWERVVEKSRTFESGSGRAGNMPVGKNGPDLQGGGETLDVRRGPVLRTNTTGWRPTCDHKCELPAPCRVLDPFAGSGTVGVVAERLGRHSVLIDAKDEYCEMARHRTAQRGLMVEAATGEGT